MQNFFQVLQLLLFIHSSNHNIINVATDIFQNDGDFSSSVKLDIYSITIGLPSMTTSQNDSIDSEVATVAKKI